MSIKTLNALLLAGILSLAAMSTAQATEGPGGPGDDNGRSHASAAPVCESDQCPLLAGDGGPSGPGDDNGRSMTSNTAGEWHPMLAGGKVVGSEFGH